jgi:hypothetical protein
MIDGNVPMAFWWNFIIPHHHPASTFEDAPSEEGGGEFPYLN